MHREKKTQPGSFDVNHIRDRFRDCPDIIQKAVYIENKYEACFIYNTNQIDKAVIQRDFIKPIIAMTAEQLSDEKLVNNIHSAQEGLLYTDEKIIESILAGSCVFIFDMIPHAVSCSMSDTEKRSIDEPVTEKNVRGPHDGFIESLDTNISLLRRRVKSDRLKFKTLSLGEQTHQKVAIAYIDGIANMDIVNSLYDKISKINIDGLPAIGYIEGSIVTHPNSIFPQLLSSERPDKAFSALLQGNVVVMQDGTPFVLIGPVSFFTFFQALDDYSTYWLHGSFLRILRIVGFIIAVLLPSFYIATTSFHYYIVPLDLLITLAESRARVPFPPIIEVLILEVIVEMIREAAVRLPTYIGTAISIFASLVIGQAAVDAGIVSNILIIIVGASAVASYIIPSFDMAMATRILRFSFTLAASVFGIIGIMMVFSMAIFHLISIESLGQPYFAPLAPFVAEDMKDTFLRFPLKHMRKRPSTSRTKNRIRGGSDGRT